jgi:hypothetical protein
VNPGGDRLIKDVLARVIRAQDALTDGEFDFALALLEDLVLELPGLAAAVGWGPGVQARPAE